MFLFWYPVRKEHMLVQHLAVGEINIWHLVQTCTDADIEFDLILFREFLKDIYKHR